MKFVKTLIASAAVAASLAAQAQVTGSLGGPLGSFLTLSSSGLAASGAFAGATLTGGTVYTLDQSQADIPKGSGNATVGSFLAVGPTGNGTFPATLTFAPNNVTAVSFLWGSPDLYNVLTVGTTSGTVTFVADPSAANAGATSLNFSQATGNQDFSQYVTFTANAGSFITSLSFNNNPQQNAFESSNYSVTAIPEPETYALMLAGLAAVGFVARRRRS